MGRHVFLVPKSKVSVTLAEENTASWKSAQGWPIIYPETTTWIAADQCRVFPCRCSLWPRAWRGFIPGLGCATKNTNGSRAVCGRALEAAGPNKRCRLLLSLLPRSCFTMQDTLLAVGTARAKRSRLTAHVNLAAIILCTTQFNDLGSSALEQLLLITSLLIQWSIDLLDVYPE
jgi:hypothetical protein